MYGKIFDSMYEGTLYGHWEAIVTLQQMLVLCNSEGVIDMTPQAIAARTSIPLEIITKGIAILSERDPYTRTPGEDGKRIILVDEHRPWGWFIVNHAKYQKMKNHHEKLEADRLRVAEKRKALKIKEVAESRIVSQPVADVAHSDSNSNASASIKESAEAPPDGGSTELWNFGIALLCEQGLKEGTARGFLGSVLRDYEPADVEFALRHASGKAEAKSYILSVLKEKTKKGEIPGQPHCARCGTTQFSSLRQTSEGKLCGRCIDGAEHVAA